MMAENKPVDIELNRKHEHPMRRIVFICVQCDFGNVSFRPVSQL